jgi:hypothetical protein
MSLINSPLKNNVLKAAEAKLESQIPPKQRDNFLKVVVSGMRVGLQGGDKSILAGLKQSKDPIKDCALGAVNLVTLLSKQSRGTMPVEAAITGAMALMLQALDFADKAGIAKVGNEELVQATKYFTDFIMERLGISKQMLAHAAQKVTAMTKNPEQMQKIKLAAGVEKAPGAQSPTPGPAQ